VWRRDGHGGWPRIGFGAMVSSRGTVGHVTSSFLLVRWPERGGSRDVGRPSRAHAQHVQGVELIAPCVDQRESRLARKKPGFASAAVDIRSAPQPKPGRVSLSYVSCITNMKRGTSLLVISDTSCSSTSRGRPTCTPPGSRSAATNLPMRAERCLLSTRDCLLWALVKKSLRSASCGLSVGGSTTPMVESA